MRQTQRLVMTPQMQQSIQLLQMNSMELEQHLNNELLENPFLEVSEGGEEEDQMVLESPDLKDEPREASDEDGDGADRDGQEAPMTAAETGEDAGADQSMYEVGGDATALSGEREDLSPNSLDASSRNDDLTSSSDLGDRRLDVEWDQVYDDSEPGLLPSMGDPDDEGNDFTSYTAAKVSYQDQLHWQLSMSSLEGKQREIGEYMLGLLDEDGYLKTPLEDIAEEFGVEVVDIVDVLDVLQEFDPPGICARDLAECLMLQLDALGVKDRDYYKIIQHHFALLQSKKFKEIAKATGMDEEKIATIFHAVGKLNPKPGRQIAPHQVQYIKPDVYVKDIDGEYLYHLNEGRAGMMRINKYYRELLMKRKETAFTPAEKEFTVGKYKSAVWLVKNIEKRKETILRVTEAIMNYQRDFLDKGIEHLRPLTLKTIAAIVNMHESTIARVTTGKYVETPRGTFELKFFFSSALETEGGEDASSRSIKEKIKQIIGKETPKKPLSDQKIADLLQQQGIHIARRTVAKYREQLKILPAKLRKSV